MFFFVLDQAETAYPSLTSYLGEKNFFALIVHFIRKSPPNNFCIADYIDQLADMIGQLNSFREDLVLIDLSALDKNRRQGGKVPISVYQYSLELWRCLQEGAPLPDPIDELIKVDIEFDPVLNTFKSSHCSIFDNIDRYV